MTVILPSFSAFCSRTFPTKRCLYWPALSKRQLNSKDWPAALVEVGHYVYFSFRTQSEQEKLNDPDWA